MYVLEWVIHKDPQSIICHPSRSLLSRNHKDFHLERQCSVYTMSAAPQKDLFRTLITQINISSITTQGLAQEGDYKQTTNNPEAVNLDDRHKFTKNFCISAFGEV